MIIGMQRSREGSGRLDDHDGGAQTKIAKPKIARRQMRGILLTRGEELSAPLQGTPRRDCGRCRR